MANPKVKFKRSSVANKRPSLSNLETGEIALNTYDGKLFTVQDTGGIGIGTTVTLVNPWTESYGTGTITYGGNVNLDDDGKLQLGDDQDLQIYHDGSHSYIDDAGTGNLHLRSRILSIQNLAGSETSAIFNSGSGQELYFNNNKKFETTNHGVIVTGILTATSYEGDGSSLTGIAASAISNNNTSVSIASTDGSLVFKSNDVIVATISSTTAYWKVPLHLDNNKITNLATPSSLSDAANKDYVDKRVAGDFPTGDYGDLSPGTSDAFGQVITITEFDCLVTPSGSLAETDLGALT